MEKAAQHCDLCFVAVVILFSFTSSGNDMQV